MTSPSETGGEDKLNTMSDVKNGNYTITVSFLFLLKIVVASTCLAFSLGLGFAVAKYNHEPVDERTNNAEDGERELPNATFPNPLLLQGKELPSSSYTSRHWKSESSASRASLYLKSEDDDDDEHHDSKHDSNTCNESYDGETQCNFLGSEAEDTDETNADGDLSDADGDHGDDQHLPTGQHLFVDIKNVDQEFLNSEVRLAKAMVAVASQSKLTLLSYHCHSLIPSGVSCVGVLLESHISFHTWPKHGVITIDLFTCGSGKLVPVLPIIEKLFGIHSTEIHMDGEHVVETYPPRAAWGHKLRGFRPVYPLNELSMDLGDFIASLDDTKQLIATVETKFQRIDIYDERFNSMLPPKFKNLFPNNRIIFLDGVQQSDTEGNEAYHEALVHPAMFAHHNPKRVAIIGGGECATLREVLKHNTVELVKMIEIDEEMVQVSKKYLPSWNTCSDLKGSADWCGDDSRADIYYGDALAWFVEHFGEADADTGAFMEEQFDILIMDALDPQDDVPFAEILYRDVNFFNALYNALTDEGIMVLQLGGAPDLESPPDERTKDNRRAYLSNSLEDVGFESVHLYEESHCDFGAPWTYLVAMKDKNTNALWNQNVAKIDLAIHQRILRTHSGNPALQYFDGDTMVSYQVPSKPFEAVHCHKDPVPENCLVNKIGDISVDNLEVKLSNPDDDGSWGIFTKVDIKQGSTIGRQASSQYLHIPPLAFERMSEILERTPEASNFIYSVMQFLDSYGRQTTEKGKESYFVDSSILAFISHDCPGNNNIDNRSEFSKSPHVSELDFEAPESFRLRDVFDPFLDRHLHGWINSPAIALVDIKEGDELLKNYLTFAKDRESWLERVQELKQKCSEV